MKDHREQKKVPEFKSCCWVFHEVMPELPSPPFKFIFNRS